MKLGVNACEVGERGERVASAVRDGGQFPRCSRIDGVEDRLHPRKRAGKMLEGDV